MPDARLPAVGEELAGALRAKLLIDGNGGPPVRDAVLTVANGRITQAGTAAQFGSQIDTFPTVGEVPVLMPGLVDCHTHPTLFPDR